MNQWKSIAVLPDNRQQDDTYLKSLHGLSCKRQAQAGSLLLPSKAGVKLFRNHNSPLRKRRNLSYVT